MSINPYESPRSQAALPTLPNEERRTANRSVRIALGILLIPALYNFLCFNFPARGNRIELPIEGLYQKVNSIGLVLTVAAIWFFGLTFLELVTGGIHSIVARKSTLHDWKDALYAIVRRMPLFAVPGALLWALWVWAFYQLQLGFQTVSIPIGILSHLLAACLYVPLIYRWYKLERIPAGQMTP